MRLAGLKTPVESILQSREVDPDLRTPTANLVERLQRLEKLVEKLIDEPQINRESLREFHEEMDQMAKRMRHVAEHIGTDFETMTDPPVNAGIPVVWKVGSRKKPAQIEVDEVNRMANFQVLEGDKNPKHLFEMGRW